MRIIGDVHGKITDYNKIASCSSESICVGDVGFDYSDITLDPNKHKIVAGNHDNYANLSPHFLGDFGVYQDFFYVRGAWSIDWAYRREYIDWFPQEQLTYSRMIEAIELYNYVRPACVISHECPASIKKMLCGESNDLTSQGLQKMLEISSPYAWYFGHHHRNFFQTINGTLFCCLNELSFVDL